MLLCAAAASFQHHAAERTTHLRVYRPSGTYPANITISPTGTVLSRSGDSPNLLILDGYSRREVPMRNETTFRVYQSRSAQLWTLTRDGLDLMHGNEWSHHPIEAIRNEIATNPLRQLRQISLLPAEVNHVLILLSDRLLDYDASTRQTRVLREAKTTQLGEFQHIQEGADDSIWISGAYGFAHIQGPARRITPQTLWGEFILPDTNVVNTLQRPLEYPPGRITSSAISAGPDTTRYVVQLENDRFSWLPIELEKIKQAWGGWDGTTWGYSSTELFRIEWGTTARLRKEPVSGAQYDMAQDTNGVFWIASSEGLIRYAPHLWRSRPDLEDDESAIHSVVFDRERGTIWCSGAEGLIVIDQNSRRVFPWPESIETLVPPRQSIFLAPNGQVLIGTENRPVFFDPATGAFKPMQVQQGINVHLLGELRDGSICVWFEKEDAGAKVDLRRFDGEQFRRIELPEFTTRGAELTVVSETARGDLWLGSSTGVILVRPSAGEVEFHGTEQGLPPERITSLADVGEGRMWCGTSTRAFEFTGQRWEPRLNTPDRVNSILTAVGSIWIGTPAGVYRLLKDSWIYQSFNEGLPGGVYTLKLSPADQLWAGTSRGLLRFHPDADLDSPRTLPPVVQGPQTPSTLEPTVINFVGQDKWDYTMPVELLFSYRLDEGNWTPYSNMTARVFQNLSSGSHVLEVRAMDRNGNESSAASRVEFAVIVPWFQDPRLLVVSVLAGCITVILAGYALNKHLQLKRSYAEVEKIVTQRTRELERANQELLHSQKMRAIGTMAAGIAHDFNNILSIIKGSAQIIESNVEDTHKIKTRVNRIQTVVEQGTAIVKALLGLGRVNENELKPCDIADLLHQTRKLLGDRFAGNIQFHVDVEPGLPRVVCSQEVVQQMLLNLVLNAAEAMGNKGLVELSARQVRALSREVVLEPAESDSYMLLSVTDQGGGISDENLPRIFEPFFTTKGFSSRRGTGLGLSMVYELAKGLGYGVAVETKVGEGSTFSIILPMNPTSTNSPAK